jgi:hypothetical protein
LLRHVAQIDAFILRQSLSSTAFLMAATAESRLRDSTPAEFVPVMTELMMVPAALRIIYATDIKK